MGLHLGGRGPRTWTFFPCFPGCKNRHMVTYDTYLKKRLGSHLPVAKISCILRVSVYLGKISVRDEWGNSFMLGFWNANISQQNFILLAKAPIRPCVHSHILHSQGRYCPNKAKQKIYSMSLQNCQIKGNAVQTIICKLLSVENKFFLTMSSLQAFYWLFRQDYHSFLFICYWTSNCLIAILLLSDHDETICFLMIFHYSPIHFLGKSQVQRD